MAATFWRWLTDWFRPHVFEMPPSDVIIVGALAWCWCPSCRAESMRHHCDPIRADPDSTILDHLTGPHGRPTP